MRRKVRSLCCVLPTVLFAHAVLLCMCLAALLRSASEPVSSMLDTGGRRVRLFEGAASRGAEDEWLPVLEEESLAQVELFTPTNSISWKFIVLFASGHVAIAKPIFDPLRLSVLPVCQQKENADGKIRLQDKTYQGFGELMAWTLDRAMHLDRKLPAVARSWTLKEFLEDFHCTPLLSAVYSVDHLSQLLGCIKFWAARFTAPSHKIYLLLQPWVKEISGLALAPSTRECLFGPRQPAVCGQFSDYLGAVSDIILATFLLDDHDAQLTKNWKELGTPVMWDNGQAFLHGPYMRAECSRILCGFQTWQNIKTHGGACQPLCRGRMQTLQAVSRLGDLCGNSTSRVLSEVPDLDVIVRRIPFVMAHEPCALQLENITEGICQRVSYLLLHLQHCRQTLGDDMFL